MRIIHSIAGTQLDHGGTSRSVPALCDALASIDGLAAHLLVGIPPDPSVESNFPSEMVVTTQVPEPAWLGRLIVGRRFRNHLRNLIANREETVVHDHGLWLQSNRSVAEICSKLEVKRVVSPRGMLSNWAMSQRRFIKNAVWGLFQKRSLLSAAGFHATSEAEAEEIRQLGFRQPIAVIPNGVRFPALMPNSIDRQNEILFLSRIHPKKGLLPLVTAFHQAALDDQWRLVIAGPDEGGHRSEIEGLIRQLAIEDRVVFTGAVDDKTKWEFYSSAKIFVLPSHSENFGICVAEALAAGLPCIASKGTPWSVLEKRDLGWWIDLDTDTWSHAIASACQMSDEERLQMGQRASQYAATKFSWSQVGRDMSEFYQWLLDPSLPKPPFVIEEGEFLGSE